jgi:hypothetical protein
LISVFARVWHSNSLIESIRVMKITETITQRASLLQKEVRRIHFSAAEKPMPFGHG